MNTKINNEFFRCAVDELKDGIIILDNEGTCQYINDTAMELLDLQEETYSDWVEQHAVRWQNETIQRTVESGGEKRRLLIEPQPVHNDEGTVIGILLSVQDHTIEWNEIERQRERAMLDSLTQTYNRGGFYQTAQTFLDDHRGVPHILLCTNVADFKFFNDLFGFQKGDDVLTGIASILSDFCKESGGICGRLHGDHFTMICPEDTMDYQKLLDAFNGLSRDMGSDAYTLIIQSGVYRITEDLSVAAMCDRANLAIDTIRRSTENQIAFYDEEMRQDVVNEKELLATFDSDLLANHFLLYIQPQFSASGKILGGEILVRWEHPTKGLLLPGSFIRILEGNGLISRLDHHVWNRAAQQLKRWQGTPLESMDISVNISTRDTYYMDIYRAFCDLIQEYHLTPGKLKLEFTETALVENMTRYEELIHRLQQKGFEVELDDFGTGFSSLSVLKDIPADVLKVDMGFLQNWEDESNRNKAILRSVISLARQLDMTVICEGVEERSQVDFLAEAGCDIFQGYYFARPMPLEDFEAMYLQQVRTVEKERCMPLS